MPEINSNSIKSWAEEDRPREKLQLKGPKSLSTSELLAIIIGQGYKNYSALDLAKEVLASANNSLDELAKLNIAQLCKIKGIGKVKAIGLMAVFELASRQASELRVEKPKISSSEMAFQVARRFVEGLMHEEFWIICLSRANKVISVNNISKGGFSATVVDPKVLFKLALDQNASGLILFHNHPSNQNFPSEEDKRLTKKLQEGAKMLDISILDHLIICSKNYFSFADNGIL